MPTYTIYRYSDGFRLPGIPFECSNDDAAIAICRAMTLLHGKSELWYAGRCVTLVDRTLA